jgi:membrane protein insertase Oxa1/YidC/SpoIIIJ
MYLGGLGILTAMGVINAWVPLNLPVDRFTFHIMVLAGIPSGVFVFLAVWLSDPKQDRANFMRLMKLAFALFFLIHAIVYFVFDPSFSSGAGLYWFSSVLFATTVTCSFFAYRSKRATSLFEKVSNLFKHSKWSNRVQIFGDK